MRGSTVHPSELGTGEDGVSVPRNNNQEFSRNNPRQILSHEQANKNKSTPEHTMVK